MAFRPCIDLKDGRVVQIVGGTLTGDGQASVNHVSDKSAAFFAELYKRDGLRGGHVIQLGPGNEHEALAALRAYPGSLQIGGGITPKNAKQYLKAGASHVIVTSYLFDDGALSHRKLDTMRRVTGRQHLVIDLSCRKGPDGNYYVATNRWQTVTDTALGKALFRALEPHCSEFLVHAADVEGQQRGIDEELVALLGEWASVPCTYAGGARSVDDIRRVELLSQGRVDLTIGSALDIFGGTGARYADAARWGRLR